MIRSPADYMAEWENVPLDPKKKKKQRVNLEPRRPMAARLTKGKECTRSFQQTFVGKEDYVTSPKSVCVGGYKFGWNT